MWPGIASGTAVFAIFIVLQIVAFRARPNQMRSRTIIRLFKASCLAHVLLIAVTAQWAAPGSGTVLLPMVSGLILLPCLFVLYMPFYYTLNTSLSVETLDMLTRSSGGCVEGAIVKERFSSQAFIRDRLETMAANGYLVASGRDTWVVTRRGRTVARVFSCVKRVLNLGPGG